MTDHHDAEGNLLPQRTPAAGPPAVPKPSQLSLTVFNPGPDAIFPVTSTIVHGPREAILVDAQFQARYADELIELIHRTGKRLTYICISHSDPDFYFGVARIARAFPEARIVATAQTAYLISATKDAKLQVWKEQLGADAPDELRTPTALDSDTLWVDGEPVRIKRTADDPAHSYLWLPSLRTVLGGISVSGGTHLWMADTPTPEAIDAWLRIIDTMADLAPARVIAGHFSAEDDSPAQLTFMRDYLLAYRAALAAARDSSGIVQLLAERFPGLPGHETLEVGAKVLTGEMDWHVSSPYPPIQRVAVVDFGAAAFRLTFLDNESMSLEETTGAGAFQGVQDTVQYTATEVSRNVFMVYWHEPTTGSNVVHLQDWNTGKVYTNVAAIDGSFMHLTGRMTLEDQPDAAR